MPDSQIRVQSQSDPKKYYIATWVVTRNGIDGRKGRWVCNCPAYMYSRTGGPCKHVKDLPPPDNEDEAPKQNVGRRAISRKVEAMTTQVALLRQHAQAAMYLHKTHDPEHRRVHVRRRNPQKSLRYKRVKGPDGKFYMTPPTSKGPYRFVPGKPGRIGTRVKI